MKTEEVAPRKPEKNQEVQQVYVTRKKETKKVITPQTRCTCPNLYMSQSVTAETSNLCGQKDKKCEEETPRKSAKTKSANMS